MINYEVFDLAVYLGLAFLAGMFVGAWLASGLTFTEYLKKYY